MDRERLKKLAADKRFIAGIYNYCDRWCERCPQTRRCLNFAIGEEEFSDPQTRDIRNEAFWKKLSGIMGETLEMLREAAEESGIDLESLDSESDTERIRVSDEAVQGHVISRAAKSYGKMVEDWFRERGEHFFLTATVVDDGVNLEEAIEVIRWYQYFIAAKAIRAILGKMEEEKDGLNEFPSDADGSAKIALIAIDRSIGAWAVIPHHFPLHAEIVLEIISFLDRLGQAIEETFPKARPFIRPGFDKIDLNERQL
jgi:hypothetical protein